MKRALLLPVLVDSICVTTEPPISTAETAGFSSERLQNLRDLIQHERGRDPELPPRARFGHERTGAVGLDSQPNAESHLIRERL